MPVRPGPYDDDDDDFPRRRRRLEPDSEDRPLRRRKRRKQASGSGLALGLILGGGGFVLVIVLVVVVVLATRGPRAVVHGPGNAGGKPAAGGSDPLVYNQKIAGATKRLSDAGTQFGNALQNCIALGATNVQDVRNQYQNVLNTLRSIRTEAATWTPPAGDSGKRLHEAYVRFLEADEALIQKFGPVVTIMENRGLSVQQKAAQAQTIIQQLAAEENRLLAEVRGHQSAFARENNIILLPVP